MTPLFPENISPEDIIEKAYELERLMNVNELILVYHDSFRDDSYEQLLRLTEMKMADRANTKKVRKRIFHIMVECVQNISRHQAVVEEPPESPSSILVIGIENGNYFILTGNPIANSKVEILEEKIAEVNSLSKEELRAMYLDVMQNQDHNEAGGANLGLIEIVINLTS